MSDFTKFNNCIFCIMFELQRNGREKRKEEEMFKKALFPELNCTICVVD